MTELDFFLDRRDDVAFIGPVGVGKALLASALGHAACRAQRGRPLRTACGPRTELASAFVDLNHARAALAEYIAFYNHERFHSALGYATPAAHELNPKPAVRAA